MCERESRMADLNHSDTINKQRYNNSQSEWACRQVARTTAPPPAKSAVSTEPVQARIRHWQWRRIKSMSTAPWRRVRSWCRSSRRLPCRTNDLGKPAANPYSTWRRVVPRCCSTWPQQPVLYLTVSCIVLTVLADLGEREPNPDAPGACSITS